MKKIYEKKEKKVLILYLVYDKINASKSKLCKTG